MKLNLGSGLRLEEGYINVDKIYSPGIDVVQDLESYPFPFDDNSVDEILCRHLICHLNDLTKFLDELHRILKPKGKVKIYAPHFSSDNFKTDPTHKTSIGYRSLNYYSDLTDWNLKYSKKSFKIVRKHMTFFQYDSRRNPLNFFYWTGFELLINKLPRVYEKFFSGVLSCNEIFFFLEKNDE